jgi:hypothetical protein
LRKDPSSCKLLKATLYFGTKKKKNKPYTNIQYVRYDDGGRSVITEKFVEE